MQEQQLRSNNGLAVKWLNLIINFIMAGDWAIAGFHLFFRFVEAVLKIAYAFKFALDLPWRRLNVQESF